MKFKEIVEKKKVEQTITSMCNEMGISRDLLYKAMRGHHLHPDSIKIINAYFDCEYKAEMTKEDTEKYGGAFLQTQMNIDLHTEQIVELKQTITLRNKQLEQMSIDLDWLKKELSMFKHEYRTKLRESGQTSELPF